MGLDPEKKKRVVLGMSGGVDSSTTAALLLRAGYEVVGVTCRFHDDAGADLAAADAASVAKLIGIPHYEREVLDTFKQKVVLPFVRAYEQGLTPSPCVACNLTCKMPTLLAVADQLDCNYIATGHYARITKLNSNGRSVVKTALDTKKDQSYMLSLLTQEQLSRLILPLGGTTKPEVRIMASDLNLPVAEKPESQDVCFFDGDYRDFLHDQGISGQKGSIVNREGHCLGYHEGLFNYTIGQRKGIGVSSSRPYYVLGKHADTNELVVGYASEAFITKVQLTGLHWQAFEVLKKPREAMVKLRYRSAAVPCRVEPLAKEKVRVVLERPQPITAPGQYAVFYEGDMVLGGGMIEGISTL